MDQNLVSLHDVNNQIKIGSTYKRATSYIWDRPDNDQHKKEYQFNDPVGVIYQEFILDDSFFETINWDLERLSLNPSTSYVDPNSVSLDDTRAFLLPQVFINTHCFYQSTGTTTRSRHAASNIPFKIWANPLINCFLSNRRRS